MVNKFKHGMLGISLGKQYFISKENMEFYFNFLDEYFEQGHMLIADMPKIHNLRAILGMNQVSAEKRVKREIKDYLKFLSRIRKGRNVQLHTWKDLTDGNYQHNLSVMYEAYANDQTFCQDVDAVVGNFLKTAGTEDVERALSHSKDYLLEELAMLCSVQLKFHPLVEIYPGESIVQELVQIDSYEFSEEIRKSPDRKFFEVYGDRGDFYPAEKEGVGKTLFANRPYERGEFIFRVTGPIVTRPTIYTVPIDDGLYIDPKEGTEFMCHSCEPSAGIKNRNELVAFRDIMPGEEIAIDYAMVVRSYDQSHLEQNLACKCGADDCRGELGSWEKLPDAKKDEYEGFVSEYLLENG